MPLSDITLFSIKCNLDLKCSPPHGHESSKRKKTKNESKGARLLAVTAISHVRLFKARKYVWVT